MYDFRYTLLFLLLLPSCYIYPTAYCLKVLKGPDDQLIFFVAEDHGMDNVPEGQDKEVVEKVLKILKGAEDMPDGGYRFLIESTDIEGFLVALDLLSSLMPHKDEFTKSTFQDIEMRKTMGLADHVFANIHPLEVGLFFQEDRAEDEDSIKIRESYQKRYGCDLSALTFADVFEDYKVHVAKLTDLASKKSGSLKVVFTGRLRTIAIHIKYLEKDMESLGIKKSDRVLDVALKLAEETNYTFGTRKLIGRALANVSSAIFNAFLLDTLFTTLESSSSKPIVIIAGGSHTSSIICALKSYFYFKVVERKLKYDDPTAKRKKVSPLTPEAFEILSKKAKEYSPVKVSYFSKCVLF